MLDVHVHVLKTNSTLKFLEIFTSVLRMFVEIKVADCLIFFLYVFNHGIIEIIAPISLQAFCFSNIVYTVAIRYNEKKWYVRIYT